MKYIGIALFIGVVMLSLFSGITTASDGGLTAEQQTVAITLAENGLNIEETLKVTNSGAANVTSVRMWIQQHASDVSVLAVSSGKKLIPNMNELIRDCNLSAANLTILPGSSLELRVTYILPRSTEHFEKILLYNTGLFTVTYNRQELFQGESLLYASDITNALKIRLYQPTEAPLSTLSLIIIFVLVVVLFSVLLLSLRKQRAKTKSALIESEETLTTKKALLLELLKELEKQYRAKSISDETYTKLKEEYKQQAVDTMKKLDDLKTA